MSTKKEKLVLHLNELEEERVGWLWPGRIAAGKPSLFDGDPSLGKSLISLSVAARLTRAWPLPDGYVPPEPIAVVLVGSEDGLGDTVLPRLKAAGADLSRVHVFAGRARDGVWSGLPTFPEDCDLLQETIAETKARLVILDPLMAFLSTRVCSLNDQLVRQALGPLAQLAQQMRAGMIWVRHLNKGGHAPAIYRGSGSVAIIGCARTAFLVGRAPADEDLRVLACTKSNLGEPPPSLGFRITENAEGQPVVTWTWPVDISADDLVLTSRLRHGESLDQAKDFLTELLAAGACSWQEVHRKAQEAGINTRTLRRAKDEMGVVSNATRANGRTQWHWSLAAAAAVAPLEPWGEERVLALQAAQEESRRFLEELCEQQKVHHSP